MTAFLSPARPAALSSGRYLDTPRSKDWRDDALCSNSGYEPDLWFPNGTTGPALVQAEEAKAVCRRCPVMETCLAWALETRQDAGVLGGLSEEERRSMIRRQQRNALKQRAADGGVPAGGEVLAQADTIALLRAAGRGAGTGVAA